MTTRIGSDAWIELLVQGADRLGHSLSPDQARKMALHVQLLLEWNQRTNLTAITDPLHVAVKHCLDAIAPLHLLPEEGALLDIGTGGGFPGIPLKIMRPDLDMTLIDSVRKKISFVNHVIRQLHLPRIEALHVRAQDLAGQTDRKARYQVVVCRALTDLTTAVSLALPLLAPQGRLIAYQGPNDSSAEGLVEDAPDLRMIPIKTVYYQLPFLDDRRKVSLLQRQQF
jgi:16S rRNA (guanine527-N7)-methyltransferase